MSENIWDCQISRKSTSDFQASLSQLTVGEKFYLQCHFMPNDTLQCRRCFSRFSFYQ